MKRFFGATANAILKRVGLTLTRTETLARLSQAHSSALQLEFLQSMPRQHSAQLLDSLPKSKAQLLQDLFVLSELGFKRGGFFIEFGATNGVDLSNTFLLEKEFGWNGILAEPARRWHEDLVLNRSSIVERKCVWSRTGEQLEFNEADFGELSTIAAFSDSDLHKSSRARGNRYTVTSISLIDLLAKHKAPREIDYLSIDTEGSELAILTAFDFNKHRIQVITCEHNFTQNRELIHDLLREHGYQRKYEHLSQFDDWYLLST